MSEAGGCQGYSPVVTAEMNREVKRLLEDENVAILHKQQAKWSLVNQEEYEKQMLQAQKMKNGGRDISDVKKEKYTPKKKTFNFDEDQLKSI